MRAVGIISKPKETSIDQEPIASFTMKVLLSVCVANRKGLPCCEVTSLL